MGAGYSFRGYSQEEKDLFAERLNCLIEKSGKTQAQVAKELGYNASTLNMWCKGNAMPTLGKIQRIADYFFVGKSDLLSNESNVPDYVEGTIEVVDLYSRITPEQRKAVLQLLRSFANQE